MAKKLFKHKKMLRIAKDFWTFSIKLKPRFGKMSPFSSKVSCLKFWNISKIKLQGVSTKLELKINTVQLYLVAVELYL